MSAASRIFLLTLALAGWVVADMPKKAPIAEYTRLWTDSPFTSKPPQPEAGPALNPLGDYALAGVSPILNGYRVTLLNKKKPEERIIVEGDQVTEGFKIVSVARKAGDPLGTVVRMMSGNTTGTVAFDEKLLTLAPPPAAAPPGDPPGVLPGQSPGAVLPGQGAQRQPRPRVIVPPPAAAQARPAAQCRNNQRQMRRPAP